MGTTFVGIGNNGFWVKDGLLELWLRLAALHIEDTVENDSLAHTVRNQWLLASRGLFVGHVPFGLEQQIATPEGKDVVLAASRSLLKALRSGPAALSHETLNLLGISGDFVCDVESSLLIELGESILALVEGKRKSGSENKYG